MNPSIGRTLSLTSRVLSGDDALIKYHCRSLRKWRLLSVVANQNCYGILLQIVGKQHQATKIIMVDRPDRQTMHN